MMTGNPSTTQDANPNSQPPQPDITTALQDTSIGPAQQQVISSPSAALPGQQPAGAMTATQERTGYGSGEEELGSEHSGDPRGGGTVKVVRSIKACDCDGGDPCLSCRLHNCACLYSKVTRKKLISMQNEEAALREGLSHAGSAGEGSGSGRGLQGLGRGGGCASASTSPAQRGRGVGAGYDGSRSGGSSETGSLAYPPNAYPSTSYGPASRDQPHPRPLPSEPFSFGRNAFTSVQNTIEQTHTFPQDTHVYPIRRDGGYGGPSFEEAMQPHREEARGVGSWSQAGAGGRGNELGSIRPDYFSMASSVSGSSSAARGSDGYPFALPPLSFLGQSSTHGDLPSPRDRLLLPPPPLASGHKQRASMDNTHQTQAFHSSTTLPSQSASGLPYFDHNPLSQFASGSSSSASGASFGRYEGGDQPGDRGPSTREINQSSSSTSRITTSPSSGSEVSRKRIGNHPSLHSDVPSPQRASVRRLQSEPGVPYTDFVSYHGLGPGGVEESELADVPRQIQPVVQVMGSSQGSAEGSVARPSKKRKYSAPDQLLGPQKTDSRLLRVLRDNSVPAGGGYSGMGGITTMQSGLGIDGVKWWGAGSFMDLQDQVVRLIRKRQTKDGVQRFGSIPVARDGSGPVFPSAATDLEYYLCRWGVEELVYEDRSIVAGNPDVSTELMFLPSNHAHRFFHSYSMSVHPSLPILNLDEARIRIRNAYAETIQRDDGSQDTIAAYQPPRADANATSLDLLILALGAGMEAGDGDAFLPKQTAVRWSRVLSAKSQGDVSGIKIWLLHAVMASIAGNVHQQYIALGIASRLVSGLGLYRESVCSLPEAEEAGFRVLFYVTLYNERVTALWQGRPSCMTDIYDTRLPEASNIRIQALHANVELSDIAQRVHMLYNHVEGSKTPADLLEMVKSINQDLKAFRQHVAVPLRDFDGSFNTKPIPLDTEEGEIGLLKCVICLMFHYLSCMTNFPLWTMLAQGDIPAELQVEVSEVAELCPASAMTCLTCYDAYCDLLPYVCFMGNLSIFVLKCVQVIYACVVQDCDRPDILSKYHEVIKKVMSSLERVDHPAALVCKNMLQDCLFQYFPRNESEDNDELMMGQ